MVQDQPLSGNEAMPDIREAIRKRLDKNDDRLKRLRGRQRELQDKARELSQSIMACETERSVLSAALAGLWDDPTNGA